MKKFIVSLILTIGIISAPILAKGTSSSGSTSSKSTSSSGSNKSSSSSSSSPKRSFSGDKSDKADQPRAAKTTVNKDAADAQDHADSRANYERAQERAQPRKEQAPKQTTDYKYKTPKGEEKSVEDDSHAKHLQEQLDEERYQRRQERRNRSFGPSVVYVGPTYSDSYHPFFVGWLAQQSYDTQAAWLYNHRYNMDAARYDAYLTNTQLANRVAVLEAEKGTRDVNYTPPGIDPDLMHTDEYVTAVHTHRSIRWGHIIWVLIKWIFYISILFGVVILILKYANWRKQESNAI